MGSKIPPPDVVQGTRCPSGSFTSAAPPPSPQCWARRGSAQLGAGGPLRRGAGAGGAPRWGAPGPSRPRAAPRRRPLRGPGRFRPRGVARGATLGAGEPWRGGGRAQTKLPEGALAGKDLQGIMSAYFSKLEERRLPRDDKGDAQCNFGIWG